MTYCTGCGNQLPDGLRFCTHCGKPTPAASTGAPRPETAPRRQSGPGSEAIVPPTRPDRPGSAQQSGRRKSTWYIVAGAAAAVLLVLFVAGYALSPTGGAKPTISKATSAPTPSSASTYGDTATDTDPATLACDSALPDGATLSVGDQRGDVEAIQWGLNQLQYVGLDGGPLAEDGYYSTALESAVERFQKNHKLTVTGEVDSTTWAVMSGQLHTWKGINRC